MTTEIALDVTLAAVIRVKVEEGNLEAAIEAAKRKALAGVIEVDVMKEIGDCTITEVSIDTKQAIHAFEAVVDGASIDLDAS